MHQQADMLAVAIEPLALHQVDRLNLVRTFVDHRDAAVPHCLLDPVFVHIAMAAAPPVAPGWRRSSRGASETP